MVLILVLPKQYPYILMGLAGNFIMHSILVVLSLRTRISVFDKAHLYPFNEIHKKEVSKDSKVDYAGMPD